MIQVHQDGVAVGDLARDQGLASLSPIADWMSRRSGRAP